MTTPLIKQITREVARGLTRANAVEPATLTRTTPGARNPGNLAAGTNPTSTEYACKGFVSNEAHRKIGGTLVDQTHLVICLVGLGNMTPRTGDKVTIGGGSYSIIDTEGSPALWRVLCRR
jgi:hypothetical protein